MDKWEQINTDYYYDVGFETVHYMGIQTLKTPMDLWVYQEILYDVKPDLIIECGTYFGGTTLFLAHIMDTIGGTIVSVDIEDKLVPWHERIKYLVGDSTSLEVYTKIAAIRDGVDSCLVILDSLHDKNHVLLEMDLYSRFVSKGSYLIVEDTNLNGHPVQADFGDAAYEAVHEYLKEHKEFEIDRTREHFRITFNPDGYLLRTG